MNPSALERDTRPPGLADEPLAPLLMPFLPALARFRAGLVAALSDASAPGEPPRLDTRALEARWAADLARRWLWMGVPTLVLELNCERMLERLAGDTPEERFASFIESLRRPDRIAELFAEYPVLERQLEDRGRQAVESARELAARLTADLPALRRTFFDDADPGPLVEAEPGAGDPHADGRSVVLLRFASGARLVYKPRSLAVDAHAQALFAWLNAHAATEPLRLLRVLDRGTHGWLEFAAAAPCADAEAARRYHVRLGAMLAVLHVVRGVDVHLENLIAAGEHPVLVDLETLFHPTPPWVSARVATGGVGAGALDDSVLRVGLLPYRLGDDDGDEPDLSGLASSAQSTPDPVVRWHHVGRDDMHAVRESVPIGATANRATLGGAALDPTAYADAIADGYQSMARLMVRERDALLDPHGPLRAFAEDRVRVVLRPTRVYGLLLEASWDPDVLRDPADREALFERLRGVSEAPALEQVLPFERRDLIAGDVPAFWTEPGSRDLWTSRGERLPEFFAESPLDAVARRLAAMDEDDIARERWLTRAALGMEVLNRDRGAWTEYPLERPALPPPATELEERALSHARAIGDWLACMAIGDRERATWIALDFRANQWSVNAEAGDLYSGSPGIVLFLAWLGALTVEPSYTHLARRGLSACLEALDRTEPERLERGLFQGLGGIVHVLAHLSALWDDPALARDALARLGRLAALCESDEDLDVVAGGAGVIAAALALERVAGDGRALSLARACGERLGAARTEGPDGPLWRNRVSGEEPASGFGHGTSGIAHALLMLAEADGSLAHRDLALAALRAEDAWLAPALERWRSDGGAKPDPGAERGGSSATLAARAERTLSMSWCHGLAGLATARLRAAYLGDDALRAEAATLAGQIARSGFGRSHCLCHGDLGSVDVLLEATRVLGSRSLADDAASWASAVLDSIDVGGWRCGTMSAVEAPGLMNGMAGIGYGLLRLADPERVPSLLSLDPPRTGRLR